MKDAIVFLYRDDYCIETLYNQLHDEIVESIYTSSDNSDINSSISSGFLKFINAEVNGKIGISNMEQRKIVTSIDRKTKILIDAYKKEKTIINEIIDDNIPLSESVYFVGRAVFFLTKIYNNATGKMFSFDQDTNIVTDSIDNNTIFELESGNSEYVMKYKEDYISSEDYYNMPMVEHTKNAIMMNMSNSKIRKSIRHITHVIKPGKLFNLYIFGELIPTSRLCGDDDTRYYIINPFAIWQ